MQKLTASLLQQLAARRPISWRVPYNLLFVFIYRRLVLSSTYFGKRDNLKLLDSIVTMKTLVGRKYYSSRRRFAETRGAIRTYSVSCKAVILGGCNAVTTKIN